MTYEVIILGHLHMPLYFIGTFTEYSYLFQQCVDRISTKPLSLYVTVLVFLIILLLYGL